MLVHSGKQPRLLNLVRQMYHVPLSTVTLISPYLSTTIFGRYKEFGRFIDRSIEDGAEASLITAPPSIGDPNRSKLIELYDDLSQRGVIVLFLERLHTKLYLFQIRREELGRRARHYLDAAVIGSANLTEPGFGFSQDKVMNEEACWVLHNDDYHKARVYAESLKYKSYDIIAFKQQTWKSR